ncbi:MAG: uroporphyrinogen decarboxylase [Phycisphaeraceae bacterium]|nr:uroporphyrinogen decarboxylase [Phycisphaeraceae bacterium]
MASPSTHEHVHAPPRVGDDSVFARACRREPTPFTPIWLMRQAGRYQPEYRRIREKMTLLDICRTPDVAAQVTLMAVEQLGVDAAIIFSDILLVATPMGFNLEFVSGEGPVIDNPVRSARDVKRIGEVDISELDYVSDALRITRGSLPPDIGLIGFAGAPFTVASYLIEGGKSLAYTRTKTLMHTDADTWHALMGKLVSVTAVYLNRQVEVGANAVQLFDSWVGALCPDDYRRYVLPHMSELITRIDGPASVIHFMTGNPALLPLMKEAGGDVIGLDWRVDLAQAWDTLGYDVAVMGNLDPVVLHCDHATIRAHARAILEKASGRPGHIFNLGHGIAPTMAVENVRALVDAVHELSNT